MIGEKGKQIHRKNWRKNSRNTVSLNNDYCDYAECCTKYNEYPESADLNLLIQLHSNHLNNRIGQCGCLCNPYSI